MRSSRIRSFAAGLLIANSAPHLATAVADRRHFTPLGFKDARAGLNALWAGLNLAAGVALLLPSRRGGNRRWDVDLVAFEAGCVVFAAWMAGTEGLSGMNHD
jgi:hypothetical protein